MDLPAGTDALISAVTAANPNTVVVIQSGTPVTVAPWVASTPALMQAWYGGNETGNAVADVLFGDANPSGKLPLTFPVRNEDNPAFLNYRSERGRTVYGEDIYIGYRFYEKTKKEVSFPFGHGLSFTEFKMSGLQVTDKGGDEIIIELDVANKGKVEGSQVVQVYVSQKSPSVSRPVKELKGFAKVDLKVGQKKKAEVKMSKKYAASFWDEKRVAWIMEKDRYEVLVGDSSTNTPLKGEFIVQKTTWWNGL
jgi:beta-glucosidase